MRVVASGLYQIVSSERSYAILISAGYILTSKPGRFVAGSILKTSVAPPALLSVYTDTPSPPTAQKTFRPASYAIDMIPEGAPVIGTSTWPVAGLEPPGGGTS